MSYFAAVLARSGSLWRAVEVDLDDCESLDDLVDVTRDVSGHVRLLVVEQDDEYAVLARVDDGDEPKVFLSDGHAADAYPIAALVADELDEIGEDVLDGDEDAPPAHDSAPFGDAGLVADLGTPAGDLLDLCAHEGTLPIDLIVAVCEKAGCADAFEALRV
jgi:putative tRNA adenosine deaminase-associated protein